MDGADARHRRLGGADPAGRDVPGGSAGGSGGVHGHDRGDPRQRPGTPHAPRGRDPGRGGRAPRSEPARRPLRTSVEGPALLNGRSGHALDSDDVSRSAHGHPSVVVLPAVLGLAEAHHASGRALHESHAVGVEVMAKLGRVAGARHDRLGWHATSTLGDLGAAAGAGKLPGPGRRLPPTLRSPRGAPGAAGRDGRDRRAGGPAGSSRCSHGRQCSGIWTSLWAVPTNSSPRASASSCTRAVTPRTAPSGA